MEAGRKQCLEKPTKPLDILPCICKTIDCGYLSFGHQTTGWETMPEQNSVAFRVGELTATITIKRTMLQDTTKALTAAPNRDVNLCGFLLGSLITNDVLPVARLPFFLTNLTDDTVTLHVGQSMLRPVGVALKASVNTAVARMGFELLRMSHELSTLQEN